MKKEISSNFIILLFLFIVWLFPITQGIHQFVNLKNLEGVSAPVTDTALTLETWLSGKFADKYQDSLSNNFGFRELAIRSQNQIQYSLFKNCNANDVIVGKNNYLYELKYIYSYYGIDYLGERYFEESVIKMKFIQDTLKKLNKTFIFLIAPSKASFYPEYIPEKYKTDNVNTNYKSILAKLKKHHVNFIDYNQMFVRLKKTCKYSLYPVAGTHWSEYGNIIAFDSLLNYIQNKTNFTFPDMDYSTIEMKDGYEGTDNDIGKAMNLLFSPKYGELAYAKLKIKETTNKIKKPSLLMVADSYWMSIYYSHKPKKMFNEHSFWYYNNMSFDYFNGTEGLKPVDLNLKDEINKKDIICVMLTEPNLKLLGLRFIEDTYDMYLNNMLNLKCRKRLSELAMKRAYYFNDIKTIDKFLKISKKDNVLLDSAISNLAKYMVDTKL